MILGLIILAAEVALCLYVLTPVLLAYRRACLDYRRLCREWTDLRAFTDAARADIDANRAAERESLIERIARDQAAVLHAEVEAVLKAAAE